MSTIIPTLGQKAPENAPRARKSNMAQVMAKSQFGDGEFDLSVLLAKMPPKRAIFEGSYPISYLILKQSFRYERRMGIHSDYLSSDSRNAKMTFYL